MHVYYHKPYFCSISILHFNNIQYIILLYMYILITFKLRYFLFSPNGKYLATGSEDNTVNLLEIESKTICHNFDEIHSCNNNDK